MNQSNQSKADAVQMSNMTWPEYNDLVSKKAPVFLPVGALEQHGPHLPLGTDALLASAIATGVAIEVGGIVAPAFSYGYKSQPKCGGGQHFTGTTSLDASTLIGQVRDTIREFVRHGVQQLVIVSGHYENQWFLIEGIDLGLRDCPGTTLRVMRLDYWDFSSEATLAKVFPSGFPGFALEHAAVFETSMMMHLFPDLVQDSLIRDQPPVQFPPYETYPVHTDWVPASGALSSARDSTREKGVLITEEVVSRIAAAVRKEAAT